MDVDNVMNDRPLEEEGLRMTDANIENRSPASIPSAATDADDLEQGLGTGTGGRKQRARDADTMSEDDQILEIKSARFYRRSFREDIIFLLICLFSAGLAVIFCLAYPRVYARLRFIQVKQNDDKAEFVLVESLDGIFTLAQIQWIFKKGDEEGWIPLIKSHFLSHELKSRDRMFVWREERFWYNDKDGSWNRRAFNLDLTYAELHTIAHVNAVKEIGSDSTKNSRRTRFLVYGSNQLRVELPNVGRLLMTEVFKPFFIFQGFSIIVLGYQDYRAYAGVIGSMAVVVVFFNVVVTRRNLQAIRKLAASECKVRMLTLKASEIDSTTGEIQFRSNLVYSSELLPGDIVEIEAGMVFPCDLLLLAGQCVVNESMLTGESAPVPKTALPIGPSASGQVFQDVSERDERHMLMSGTTAIQIRGSTDPRLHRASDSEDSDQHPSIWEFLGASSTQTNHSTIEETSSVVVAMVIRTAYGTTKGKLVRAIRFAKPSKYNFEFEKKIYYFVVTCGICLIPFCALTIYFQAKKERLFDIFYNCLNLMTVAVPVALPLALSVGISVSFKRLQENGVYCINSGRIVCAGRVDTLCFDKTGTITEDGLNLRGVVPVIESEEQSCYKKMSYGPLLEDPQAVYLQGEQALVSLQAGNSPDKTSLSSLGLFYTLAACHSISVLDHIIETRSGMANEDRIRDQMRKPGLWLQRFRELFGALRYNRFHAKYPGNGSEPDAEERCQFIGDPLEIEMFTSTGWRYISRPFEELFWSVDGTNPPMLWTDVLRIADTVIMAPGEGVSKPPLAILRRFDFDSELRLMSSIVLELPGRSSNTEFVRSWLLVKGAPESLQDICVPESLPDDYTSRLHDFSHKGYRVLTCAYRDLGSMTIPQMLAAKRQEMEKELTYCGFLIMENKLKPETSGVLLQLAEAGLRQVMVTGDSPFTAAAVARQSGPFFLEPSRRTYLLDRTSELSPDRYKSGCVMKSIDFPEENLDVDALLQPHANVSEYRPHRTWNQRSSNIGSDINLIVTGRAFAALTVQHDQLREQFMERTGANDIVKVTECVTPLQMVLTEANIFSRMSPQHKTGLMRSLQDLGYVVCMTGSGANDSGALKAADVGISISSKHVDSTDSVQAGPSIAAPFSTKLGHIGAVPMVLAEGRCALVTSTSMLKYMFFYALIQATSVLVLYRLQLELHDNQYLWADLGIVLPIVLFMAATRPRKKLSRGKPIDSLLDPAILISVLGQSVFIILFQVLAQIYLVKQNWYTKPDGTVDSVRHNVNTTVSFLFSSFQYVGLAMALSQSFGTFRKSPFTNILLSVTLICHLVLCSWFLLEPTQLAIERFHLVDVSAHKRFVYGLWMMATVNILLSILFERYVVRQKSPELDMSNSRHEEPEGDNIAQKRFALDTTMRWLKDEVKFSRNPGSIEKIFFIVKAVASTIWSQLSQTSSSRRLLST